MCTKETSNVCYFGGFSLRREGGAIDEVQDREYAYLALKLFLSLKAQSYMCEKYHLLG